MIGRLPSVSIVGLLVVMSSVRAAHAISACEGEDGWSPQSGSVLPPRARIAYWTDDGDDALQFSVKLDGKAVAIKTTKVVSKPYVIRVIEIDSARTGTLEVSVKTPHGAPQKLTYTIKRGVTFAKQAKATTSRYHKKIPHTSVREVFDGLAIAVNVPALYAHVKIRRDAQSQWRELDVPLVDGKTARIGEIGCASNYTPQLLEQGVDIEATVMTPAGSQIPIAGLTRVTLPKLAKPTGTRPWDDE